MNYQNNSNNQPSLTQLRSEILVIKRHIINLCCNKNSKPEIKELEELIMVKVELEDTTSIAVKLIQIWTERNRRV